MNAEFLAEYIIAIVLIVLGVFILSRHRRHAASITFCLMCLALSSEVSGVALWKYQVTHEVPPVLGAKLTQLFHPFVGCFPAIFSGYFPWPSRRGRLAIRNTVLCLVASFFSVVGLFDLFIREAPPGSARP